MKIVQVQLIIKRMFDILGSVFLIVLLTVIPILIIIPVIIKLTSKGPAVFRQERIGKDGKPFYMYKFRTMDVPPVDAYYENGVLYKANGDLFKSEERIYPFGKFLRKTSLDELMQLFNIVNGTMSFVGPRPTLGYQVELYSAEQKRRLEMRPGVTGWAQINGRNALTWTEKINYDLYYVDNFNLWLDIIIFFKTIFVVLSGKGVEFSRYDKFTTRKK